MYGKSQKKPIDHSLSQVLRLIKNDGPITRVDLAQQLHMSAPTISRLVERLTNECIVQCTGNAESHGGRKPSLYTLYPEGGYSIGVDITKRHFVAATFDLSGTICERYTRDPAQPQEFLSTLVEFLEEILAANKDKRIFGIGIGISGNVVHQTKILRYSNLFDFHDVPLERILSNKLPIPVIVEERVRCAAFAGSLASDRADSDVIYMQVGTGIGVGIVHNGELFYGNGESSAGEIGHMILDINGPECSCGGRGCLEQLASETAIIREVVARGGYTGKLNGQSIVDAAQAGNECCFQVVDQAIKYLAIGIINLFMIFNPNRIIITNHISNKDDLIKDRLYHHLNRLSARNFSWNDSVLFDQNRDMSLQGGAMLVLEEIFQNPMYYSHKH